MYHSQEREEAAKSVENSSEHSELLERINQLNILRESNATLRAESDANVRKTRQLEAKLNELQTEVGPLKEEVTTLRAEVEAKDRQIQRLEDENRQWKERNSQLLTKVSPDFIFFISLFSSCVCLSFSTIGPIQMTSRL